MMAGIKVAEENKGWRRLPGSGGSRCRVRYGGIGRNNGHK